MENYKPQRSGSISMPKNVVNDGIEAVTTIEDAIALIGGFGRFQWILSFVTMGNYVRSALTYYPLPYLELFPVYMCTSASQPTPYECKAESFCGDDSITYTIDASADTSLNNWVEQLDLTCKSDSEIGLIGSSYFIGIIFSMFTVVRASDLYGRKWPIILCQLLQLPIYFWMFYMKDMWEAYACFFIFGLGFGGSVSINTLYMQEFMMKKHRAIVLTVAQSVSCQVAIIHLVNTILLETYK